MVTITENASKKLSEIMTEEKKAGYGLRLLVQPGGCSGYSYGLDFSEKATDGDSVSEQHGIKLFIDKEALPLIEGAEIDYVEDIKGSGFAFKNPNAKHSCNCGSSFSC